jgi:hypothetical protein
MRLQGQFEALPDSDKVNVIELVKLGQRHVDPSAMEAEAIPELSEAGRDFIKSDLFRERYDMNVHREPPPQAPNSNEMNPVVRGLFEVIKQLQGSQGLLKDDNSNRMGAEDAREDVGEGDGVVGGFEGRLGEAFKVGGAKGLAKMHRELLSDPGYNKFLKGD